VALRLTVRLTTARTDQRLAVGTESEAYALPLAHTRKKHYVSRMR